MSRLFLAALVLVASLFQGVARDVDDLMVRTPNAPKTAPVKPAPKGPQSPRPNADGDQPINPDQTNLTITAIILVPSRADIKESGVSGVTGVQTRGIPSLDNPDFRRALQPFLGKPMTENRIRDIEDAIILYCRTRGKLLVDVILPEQNIDSGALQMWFLEGVVGNVGVKNEGRKWFKDQFILSNVGLQPGHPIDSLALTKDLNWLNNNPFRQVDAVFKPGSKLGLTDVDLRVEDRMPVRPYLGYENTGTEYTGPDRLLVGFNWGNVFGLDHQLNYQYMTDVDFDLVKAHSVSYIAPLPWRHSLILYGSYVDGRADFSSLGLGVSAKGTSWQLSERYSMSLPSRKQHLHELSAGFDFKRSDNNLGQGGTTVSSSDTDVAQFALGYNGIVPDRFGRTSLNVEGYWSPGGLGQNNNSADFNRLRTNSPAHYFYLSGNFERITRLPAGCTWIVRGWGQVSTERLQSSEELALGGYNTVRGYHERVIEGDQGWILSNEVRTPPWAVGELLHRPQWQDSLQLLAFLDCGSIRIIDPVDADGDQTTDPLCSWGGGLRYTVSKNFSLRFDYGFPLTQRHAGGLYQTGRGHVAVTLSY